MACLLGAVWLSSVHHHEADEHGLLEQTCGVCIAMEASSHGVLPVLSIKPVLAPIMMMRDVFYTHFVLFQSIGFAYAQSRAPPFC